MRLLMTIAAALVACCAAGGTKAHADPYRWCAMYSAKGATNCYFMTLEQCRAALAGNGGFCNPNNFYDGRPVVTPGEGIRRRGR